MNDEKKRKGERQVTLVRHLSTIAKRRDAKTGIWALRRDAQDGRLGNED